MTTDNTILTITGSDSSGESGLQADIRTMAELGAKCVSAVTSITLQNTLGIQEFYDLPAEVVGGQLDAIVDDVRPSVVKIGMVRSAGVLDVVVGAVRRCRPAPVVYDPILFSSRGDQLMGTDVVELIRAQLLPLCTVVVVRRPDVASLVRDVPPGRLCFIDGDGGHGSANHFASALAVYLGRGDTPAEAEDKARAYIRQLTARADHLQGRGGELYNEFVELARHSFASNSDVSYYAGRLNVSTRYLAQVCRRISGHPPKAIIDQFLLRGIEVRLATTSASIQQIAQELGFSSQAHLSKLFKKLTGQTPSEYRNNKKR